MKKFEFFDHTGDEGVVVYGTDIKELFTHAAEAFFSVLTDPHTVRRDHGQRIMVQADDYEELLVAWLNELLFLFETDSLLFHWYEIQEIDRRNLTAFAWGERFDPKRHPINHIIKAVTYHLVKVTEHDGYWEARVIFDL